MKLIPLAGALLLAAGTVSVQTDGPVLRVAEAVQKYGLEQAIEHLARRR